MIQNADDNDFLDDTLPSLTLRLYEKGDRSYFSTDCNEVGFTFKQIDALTLVGQSTKIKARDGKRGYIGEKGIGFKSVFKVADIVQIASGYYEFKLDRTQELGMLVPIPRSFPVEDRNETNGTQLRLKLRNNEIYRNILTDMQHLQPQLLIFLRKLHQLTISTPQSTKKYICTVNRSDDKFGGESATIESTTNDGQPSTLKYLIHRHEIEGLPIEARRTGYDTSEMVLAFPVGPDMMPLTAKQKVFAFLPIDDFGFQVCFFFL